MHMSVYRFVCSVVYVFMLHLHVCRQTDRQTDRQIDRHKQTERQRETERDRER